MVGFILGILLTAAGAAMLWKPEFVFELTEGWKHSGSTEPSEAWIFSTRVGGVMCVLVGIGNVIVPFIPQ